MPARIRLQRRGTRNDPYYIIVIQSNKTNPRGKVIEKTGYFYPDRWNKGERQVILNRPRLKYWLGVGAEPTKGIVKLLGKVGFLPKRPPPFGTHTLYKTESREELKVEEIEEPKATTNGPSGGLEFFRQPSEMEMMSEVKDVWSKYSRLLESFDKKYPNGTTAQRLAIMKLFTALMPDEERITTTTLMRELNISKEEATQILKDYKSIEMPFTGADIDDLKADLKFKSIAQLKEGKTYTPSPNPITPVPDFDDESNDHIPRVLFESKVKPRPTSGPYGFRFKRTISFLASPMYLRFIDYA